MRASTTSNLKFPLLIPHRSAHTDKLRSEALQQTKTKICSVNRRGLSNAPKISVGKFFVLNLNWKNFWLNFKGCYSSHGCLQNEFCFRVLNPSDQSLSVVSHFAHRLWGFRLAYSAVFQAVYLMAPFSTKLWPSDLHSINKSAASYVTLTVTIESYKGRKKPHYAQRAVWAEQCGISCHARRRHIFFLFSWNFPVIHPFTTGTYA